MPQIGTSLITINQFWTDLKASIIAKDLPLQYEGDTNVYSLFAIDSPVVYVATIFKGEVPYNIVNSGYSQAQNDLDKADFETNYKTNANKLINRGQFSREAASVSHGFMNVSASGAAVIRLSAYTEPTSAGQRSLVSTSVNDTVAGTGARAVRVTYYDGALNGPFTEDVTMNGTTPVNTIATNIRFIEEMHVVSSGSLLANAGNISLMTGAGGAGTTIGKIIFFTVGFNQTFWAHHYVITNKTTYVRWVAGSIKVVNANFYLKVVNPLVVTPPAFVPTPVMRVKADDPTRVYDFGAQIKALGPARVDLVVDPDSATAGTVFGGFGYYDI